MKNTNNKNNYNNKEYLNKQQNNIQKSSNPNSQINTLNNNLKGHINPNSGINSNISSSNHVESNNKNNINNNHIESDMNSIYNNNLKAYGLLTKDNSKENIKVALRIRPKIDIEKFDAPASFTVTNNSIRTTMNKYGGINENNFTFDYIATEDIDQGTIFERCAKEISDNTFLGINGSIFVYGQTGAGKTYTLIGAKSNKNAQKNKNTFLFDNSDSRGILPRTVDYLLKKAQTNIEKNTTINFYCSFLEIYNETLYDLIDPSDKDKIEIRTVGSDLFEIEGNSGHEANTHRSNIIFYKFKFEFLP